MCLRIAIPATSLVGSGRGIGANCPEAILQKALVDRARPLRQRLVHVDDLVEPGSEQILLTALLRPHLESSLVPYGPTESSLALGINLQEIAA
jgi:hypothetical protein